MLLLTQAQKNKLIENHKAQDGTKEFKAEVKLFNPTGAGTWYLSELDPETNIAYGLCHIHDFDFGSVSLNELSEFKGQFGLGIERDKYFTPKSFEECKNAQK
jgi:hypothetical protein|tara:strand:- start:1218 stop:1523 length:306 start_codon:yes stop_codon:yes gene_type:complete